jgi:hypothetical protein
MSLAITTARLRGYLHPATITLIVLLIVVAGVIVQAGGDPLALARLGTKYSQGEAAGTDGYDGQFIYYIARDLSPKVVRSYLDLPAYRYQRILLPLLARLLSLNWTALLPWMLAVLGMISHTAGTWAVAELLTAWGVSRWYALVYGLWAGFILSVRLDLPEPLAFGLVAGALLAQIRRNHWLAWLLLGLSLFAKEVTAIFVLAVVLCALLQKKWGEVAGLALVTVLPYALFQVWLWWEFGQPGVGSGGAMATPFEIIPFMGLLRIGSYSLLYLLAMLVVFGPAVILPSIWGVWAGVRKWLEGNPDLIVIALVFNALVMFFLPFSTYRETGGLLRFACGLVLSVLLFGARYHLRKVLNYSLFWLVMNAFLLKS